MRSSTAGCLVEEVAPPDVSQATAIFFGMMAADGGARARIDLAHAEGRHIGQMTSLLDALEGQRARRGGLLRALPALGALRATIRSFVAAYDVVLAPVTVGAAPLHGCTPGQTRRSRRYDVFNFTHTFSVAGLPVAVSRSPRTAGLPLGVQVVANPFHDRVALSAAALLEAARQGCPDRRSATHRPSRP